MKFFNKKTVNFSVTQNGQPLDPSLYTWNEQTRIFSTNENNLVLDFTGIDRVVFKTGSDCTFDTGFDCTFKTGSYCTFKTGFDCTFNTGSYCTFKTGSNCTFDTGSFCTFNTICDCTFKTGSNCTFKTGSDCTFDTGSDCTFDTAYNCTFKTGKECVIIRRDMFEVIKLEQEFNHIKLNKSNIPGYEEMLYEHIIMIDGKEIKISNESYEELKKQLK